MAIKTFSWPGVSVNTTGIATEAKQDVQITELQDINTELDTQTLELQSINSNTASIAGDILDVVTELQAVNTELNTQTTFLDLINLNVGNILTSAQQTAQNTAETKIELEGVNTELDSQTALLTSIDTSLNTIETVDFATEATLAALEAKDFATETTLGVVSANIALIDSSTTNIDISTSAINTKLDTTNLELNAISTAVTGVLDVAPQVSYNVGATDATTQRVHVSNGLGQQIPTAIVSASVTLPVNVQNTTLPVVGGTAPGSPAGNVVAVAGSDGSATRTLLTDSSGRLQVSAGVSSVLVPHTFRQDYSITPVTTATWTQLIASTSATLTAIEIFDSSGQTLELGTGAAASETRLIYITPGGNGRVTVSVPSGTRLSVRAVSANADTGELTINFYS